MKVTLLNSVSTVSNKQCELPLSNHLSKQGKTLLVLLDLTSSSLMFLSQSYNDRCNINLDKDKLSAHEDSDLIIEGARNKTDGLWDIPLHH